MYVDGVRSSSDIPRSDAPDRKPQLGRIPSVVALRHALTDPGITKSKVKEEQCWNGVETPEQSGTKAESAVSRRFSPIKQFDATSVIIYWIGISRSRKRWKTMYPGLLFKQISQERMSLILDEPAARRLFAGSL